MAATQRMTFDERNVRVEDYLDDKLQTTADFESLESLLSNVKPQHTLLKQQVKPGLTATGNH